DEGHALAIDRVEAHPKGRGLRLGDLPDIGSLLVGPERPAADDLLRLADHQPGEVIAIHRPPGSYEQVVAELEPGLEAAQARLALEPVALLDELAGPGDELVAGHRGVSPRMNASRSARARSVHGPGRPDPIDSPANRVTGRIPAT